MSLTFQKILPKQYFKNNFSIFHIMTEIFSFYIIPYKKLQNRVIISTVTTVIPENPLKPELFSTEKAISHFNYDISLFLIFSQLFVNFR